MDRKDVGTIAALFVALGSAAQTPEFQRALAQLAVGAIPEKIQAGFTAVGIILALLSARLTPTACSSCESKTPKP